MHTLKAERMLCPMPQLCSSLAGGGECVFIVKHEVKIRLGYYCHWYVYCALKGIDQFSSVSFYFPFMTGTGWVN
jgi:hypothetical protein